MTPSRFHSGDPCRRHPRRGFTLIEVMMATVIIGLGILGLLALFAGAARQQQLSSQTTAALQATQNAMSRIQTLVGTIDGPGLATRPEGVWAMAHSKAADRSLTLTTSSAPAQQVYFLVEPSETVPATMFEFSGVPMPMSTLLNSAAAVGAGGALIPLVHGRVDPDTVSFQVELYDTSALTSLAGGPFIYTRANASSIGMDTLTQTPDRVAYYLNGDANNQTNYILLDTKESVSDPAARAELVRFDFSGFGPNRAVTAVRALDYRYRNDSLLSLTDRVIFRNDPAERDGRRPEFAFSMLYRRTRTASQIALFAYTLTPPAVDADFVPTDTISDSTDGAEPPSADVSPLALVELTLGWDDTRQEYYFETVDDNLSWALQPGQELLVAGTDATDPGADLAVRVLRLERLSNNNWRAALNDSPRRSQQSYLSSRSAAPVMVEAWAVRDIVRSATDRGVSPPRFWKLRPISVQINQLAN